MEHTVAGTPPPGLRKVVIIQRRLTHYRLPLFELMREKLAARGVDLVLAYGNPTVEEESKRDSGQLAWGVQVPCRYWLNGRLCWQNAFPVTAGAELVVFPQENKLIFNYLFDLFRGRRKMAFWGHGRNFQTKNTQSLSERLKRWLMTRADWWFAYTEMTQKIVVDEAGFPAAQVTVLNNSIDTSAMTRMFQAVSPAALASRRQELGLVGGHVGIFVGSLYEEKRIAFMLEAALLVRQAVPDFEFLIVGSGPDEALVQTYARQHPWIKYLGIQKGQQKVDLVALAQVMINPGLVGLGILDSFVCGVPLLTTDCGLHSPEIGYLDHGVNGIMTGDTLDGYAAAVVGLLQDQPSLQRLRAGCFASAQFYSVENMAENFSSGIVRCLA